MNPNERERRSILIRNAILGLARRYPSSNVAVISTFDLLTLLLQQWVALVIWKRRGDTFRPTVSTLCDPLLKEKYGYPRVLPSRAFKTWRPGRSLPHSFNAVDLLPDTPGEIILTVGHFGKAAVKADAESLNDIAFLLKDDAFWSEVKTEFERIFTGIAPFQRQPGRLLHCQQQLQGDNVTHLYDSLRGSLNEFLESKADSPFLSYASGSSGFPKLHFCLKWGFLNEPRHKKWPYTARLVIPAVQRRILGLWASDNEKLVAFYETRSNRPHTSLLGEFIGLLQRTPLSEREATLVRVLETPLHAKSRAIADSSLASGCLDFDHEPGGDLDTANSDEDMLRQEAEAFMYWACHTAENASRSRPRPNIVYIPIHVNGAPWLDLYSFSSGNRDDPQAWDHNYLLYRDLLPELGGRVREHVSRSYVAAITSLLRKTVNCRRENVASCIAAANEEFERLAVFCPMPQLHLSVAPQAEPDYETSDLFFVPGLNRDIRLSVRSNAIHPSHLSLSILYPTDLLHICTATLRDEVGVRNDLENRSLAYNTHLLGTPLRALETYLDSGDTALVRKTVRRLNSLRNYATALVDENKRSGKIRVFSSDTFVRYVETLLAESLSAATTTFNRTNPVRLTSSINEPRISFYEDYVQAALCTAVENAVEHGVDGAEITVEVKTSSIQKGAAYTGALSAFMTNKVRSDLASLRQRITTLNNPRLNNIGVMTLRLGAEVYLDLGQNVRYWISESVSKDIHHVILELPIATTCER